MKRFLSMFVVAALAGILATDGGAASGRTTRQRPSKAPLPTAQVTQIQRYRFPERGYVLDLPHEVALNANNVQLTENGRGIADFTLAPLTASGLRFGVVLAIDASDSMTGNPLAGAVAAARSFVDHRGSGEEIGLVTFNASVQVLRAPTADATSVQSALAQQPPVAYGTHIFDAVDQSLALLEQAGVSTGAIVLLSDGADVGSSTSMEKVIAAARDHHLRIFTVGLRSAAYDPQTLSALAKQTGGSYAEATSPGQLAQIYAGLSSRLARDYVLQYRSLAPPRTRVDVEISVRGYAAAKTSYSAPTPAGLAPYHRPLLTRFLLSPASLVILAMLIAVLVLYTASALLRRRRSDVVDRVRAFAISNIPGRQPHLRRRRRRRSTSTPLQRWFAGLERDLDIGQIRWSVTRLLAVTLVAMALVMMLLALVTPVFCVLGLLVPFLARGFVNRRVASVRDKFATQLPSNIQILASALRSGHSFAGALAVVVENADDPSRRELRRAVSDEQLGVPLDEALQRVATRMQSRDLEQVALVAELQRTTGGNAAEVLDVVVATIREREDVRRLVKTLTAQGRLARWILTALPVVVGVGFYAIQPGIAGPMYRTAGGQVALVVAILMVATGSFVIQKIVEIDV